MRSWTSIFLSKSIKKFEIQNIVIFEIRKNPKRLTGSHCVWLWTVRCGNGSPGVVQCKTQSGSVLWTQLCRLKIPVWKTYLQCAVFGVGTLGIKTEGGPKSGSWFPKAWCPDQRKGPQSSLTRAWAQKTPCEEMVRRKLSARRGAHQTPTLLAPWSRTSRLQNCEHVNLWV